MQSERHDLLTDEHKGFFLCCKEKENKKTDYKKRLNPLYNITLKTKLLNNKKLNLIKVNSCGVGADILYLFSHLHAEYPLGPVLLMYANVPQSLKQKPLCTNKHSNNVCPHLVTLCHIL